MSRRLNNALKLLATSAALAASSSFAANTTECTANLKLCYCVNDDFKPVIEEKVKFYRQQIADARAKGKAVAYMSLPLSTLGGGFFDVNTEVAKKTKDRIEARFGVDSVWVLSPGTKESDLSLPSGARGTNDDYMLMWTTLLEGTDGLGEFDFVYFAGPGDFARYFGFDGVNDGAKLDAYYDARVKSNPGFAKAVEGGLTKPAFRRYYLFRASATVSRGAHDEWNIFRIVNEKRRADPKIGAPGQIPILFDGRGVNPTDQEAAVSEGYVGKCAM